MSLVPYLKMSAGPATLPPISLWQVLQIRPLLVALRVSLASHAHPKISRIITAFVVARGVFHQHNGRSWYRAGHIVAARYLLRARKWTVWELRYALGATTVQVYSVWARKNRVEALTDELPEGARLHWIGPRRKDRVILYFHGAYLFFSHFAVRLIGKATGGLYCM